MLEPGITRLFAGVGDAGDSAVATAAFSTAVFFTGLAAAKVKSLKMIEIWRIRSAGCNKRCEKNDIGSRKPVGRLSAIIRKAASDRSNKDAEYRNAPIFAASDAPVQGVLRCFGLVK